MTDESLRSEASSWFLAHRLGEMTPADRQAFNVWIENSSARLAYREAERTWGIAADLGNDPEIAAIRKSLGRRRWHRLSPRWWSAGALAACAAAVAIVVPDQLTSLVDVQLSPFRGGGQVLSSSGKYRTATKLADGSEVTLGPDTRLRVLEMGAQRRIELLAGHAFFRVAKDPLHPFLVTAMNKTVHAIGTAFDVRVEPNAVAVTLVEGKVRVDQSRGLLRRPISTNMTAGKQLVAANDQVWLMSSVDTRAATSWLRPRLTYTEGMLGQIIADVNAGSERKIVFLDPIDKQQRLVGSFEQGDVDTLATVIEMKGIAHVVARNDSRIEMR